MADIPRPPGPLASSWPDWRRSFLAGCVKQDAPGVGIQKLAADIVFGVKPAPETPPPNLAPGQVGPGDATTYVPDAADVVRPVGARRQ